MKLTDITLSFPIINYRMKITHFSARISTAIEWAILEAINKIESNPNSVYARYSVDLFFSQIFLIGIEGDSNKLIKPCLFNLIDRNAIICRNGLGDETDLRDVSISSFSLTESGKEMQKKGLLPGEDSDIQYSILYDVIKKEIKAFNERVNLTTSSGGLVISEDETNLKNTPLPVTQVKEYILELQKHQKTAPGWLQPTTEIKDIKLDDDYEEPATSVLWNNRTYNVNCTKNMQLSVGNLMDDTIDEFVLNEIESKDSRDLISISKIPTIEIKDVDNEITRLSSIDDISDILADLMDRDKFFFVNNEIIDFDIDSILKDESSKICLIFDDNDFSVESNKNLVIRLPGELNKTIRVNALYGNMKEAIYLGCFSVNTKNTSKDIYLCYTPKNESEDLTKIVNMILDKYSVEQNLDLMYLLLIINQKEKFITTCNKILQQKNTYKEKVLFIDEVFKKISHYSLSINASKEDFYLRNISWNDSNEKESIRDIITELKNNYTFQTDQILLERCLEKLFDGWKSCDDINFLWEILDKAKINRNTLGWILKSTSVKKLFSDEILMQIINMYGDSDFIKIPRYTKFEEILIRLKNNQIELAGLIKPLTIPNDLSNDSFKSSLLKGRFDLAKINENIKKRKELLQNLDKYLSERKSSFGNTSITMIEDIPSDSYFMQSNKSISIVAETVMEFFEECALKYDKIYVVDTCAVMNAPELVDHFSNNKSAFIVPKKVLEELNRNKDFTHDADKSSKAQTAISHINKYDQQNVPWLMLEDSHPELLPPEYPITLKNGVQEKEITDNLILSVALKYKVRKVILITDDKNMQLKASSEKISYQPSTIFSSKK